MRIISSKQEQEVKKGDVFERYAYTWFMYLCETVLAWREGENKT